MDQCDGDRSSSGQSGTVTFETAIRCDDAAGQFSGCHLIGRPKYVENGPARRVRTERPDRLRLEGLRVRLGHTVSVLANRDSDIPYPVRHGSSIRFRFRIDRFHVAIRQRTGQ